MVLPWGFLKINNLSRCLRGGSHVRAMKKYSNSKENVRTYMLLYLYKHTLRASNNPSESSSLTIMLRKGNLA